MYAIIEVEWTTKLTDGCKAVNEALVCGLPLSGFGLQAGLDNISRSRQIGSRHSLKRIHVAHGNQCHQHGLWNTQERSYDWEYIKHTAIAAALNVSPKPNFFPLTPSPKVSFLTE